MRGILDFFPTRIMLGCWICWCCSSSLWAVASPSTIASAEYIPTEFLQKFEDSISEQQLPNGVPYIQKNHSSDITYLTAILNWSSTDLRISQRTLPYLVAALLTKGTKSYPRDKLAKTLAKYAIKVSCSPWFACSTAYSRMSCTMVVDNEYLDQGLDIFTSILKEPSFESEDFKVMHQKSINIVKSSCQRSANVMANNILNTIFYDAHHPWYTTSTSLIQSLELASREDVIKAYKGVFNAQRLSLISISSQQPEQMLKKLATHLTNIPSWFYQHVPVPAPVGSSRNYLVKPADESSGVIGDNVTLLFKSKLPGIRARESVALRVLHQIFNDKLYEKIRTQAGLSYAPSAYYAPFDGFGISTINISTSEPAKILVMLSEVIQQLQNSPVSEQMLNEAKSYLLSQFYIGISTPFGVRSTIASLLYLNRLDAEFLEFPEKILKVNSLKIQALAKIYLGDYKLAFYGKKEILAQIKKSELIIP